MQLPRVCPIVTQAHSHNVYEIPYLPSTPVSMGVFSESYEVLAHVHM
jgi:hypothetical protein